MPTPRPQRRLTGWIALLAILWAALAPALSHAVGAGKGSPSMAAWIEVCSAEGSKWVASGPGEPAEGAPAATHPLAHCPGCLSHAPALGLPPADVAVLPLPGLKYEQAPAFLAAPTTPHAWISAQPRAPPSSSLSD